MASKSQPWKAIADSYDPIAAGSIDGTDSEPHDKAIDRALVAHYEPDPFIKSKSEYTVFVARLNVNTSEAKLESIFSKYGKIRHSKLIRDVVTGFSRGYAFIEYESRSSVSVACREADGLELEGRKIFVDQECQKELAGWIPRRLGGGLGGNKGSGQLRFGGKDRPFRKPFVPEKLENKTSTLQQIIEIHNFSNLLHCIKYNGILGK